MKNYELYDKVSFVTNSELRGIIVGIITRPGTTTYLVRIDSDPETEHYRNELVLIKNN